MCLQTCRCSSWLLILNLSCRVVMSAQFLCSGSASSSPSLACRGWEDHSGESPNHTTIKVILWRCFLLDDKRMEPHQ